jgi:hypothetical protein
VGSVHAHVCGDGADFKPGDAPPEGYLAWHEWARVQRRAGLHQRRCGVCARWKFPVELSGKTIKSTAISTRPMKVVAVCDPVCIKCAAAPSRREEDGRGT